jgi:copper homeostasis protein
MPYLLEISCFNLPSALIAQAAGAGRIELCASPSEGGTTPSFGAIKLAREKLHIPLYPILRSRGGDFLASDEEFDLMRNDLTLCRQLNCDGVVAGLLLPDGRVDKTRMSRLVAEAYPLGVTFHRAFDQAINPFAALEDIIACGCERLLSSGQHHTAVEGAALLNALIREAAGRIEIMPGSGVRAANIGELAEKTGAEEFHSSARRLVGGQMQFFHPVMAPPEAYPLPDPEEIRSMLECLAAITQAG